MHSFARFDISTSSPETIQVTHVFFLDLKFQTALPNVPKDTVRPGAMVKNAVIARLLQFGLPFAIAPFELRAEMIIGKTFAGGQAPEDFAGDVKHRLTSFHLHSEHMLGIMI